MFLFLKIFLTIIVLYHVLHTIFVFGILWSEYGFLISSSKDLIWLLFIIILVVVNYKTFFWFLKKYYKLINLFIFLLIWSIIISIINHISVIDMIIWFKYGIYFMVILISSIFIWYIVQQKKLSFVMKGFFEFFFYLILISIVFGWVWHVLKLSAPSWFYSIWYWYVWDFKVWENPPIYYRTGKWWDPRFSWLMSWPNNLWYLMVLFFWFFMFYVNELLKISKEIPLFNIIKKFFYKFYYILLLIITFSRWAMIWVWVQLYVFLIRVYKLSVKKLFFLTSCFVLFIVMLSLWKWSSTSDHIDAYINTINYVIKKPFWYGLGISWPSANYDWYIMPENMFFQILIDLWVIWLIIWLWIMVYILKIVNHICTDKSKLSKLKENEIMILKLLTLWLIWLLIEWMFLHVFEDSIVNYLFFVFYGIMIWYLDKQKL